jgi:hypothetical protein
MFNEVRYIHIYKILLIWITVSSIFSVKITSFWIIS